MTDLIAEISLLRARVSELERANDKLASLLGVVNCSNCHIHEAMHLGEAPMCCRCYVGAGNPPADWHVECMKAYDEITAKGQNNDL